MDFNQPLNFDDSEIEDAIIIQVSEELLEELRNTQMALNRHKRGLLNCNDTNYTLVRNTLLGKLICFLRDNIGKQYRIDNDTGFITNSNGRRVHVVDKYKAIRPDSIREHWMMLIYKELEDKVTSEGRLSLVHLSLWKKKHSTDWDIREFQHYTSRVVRDSLSPGHLVSDKTESISKTDFYRRAVELDMVG